LLAYRRYQLGLEFDRSLFRQMNRFGLPLVPSALALWAINFIDRLFLVKLASASEVGLYSIGVRVSSATVLLLTAFRTAWPAFAGSIVISIGVGRARRTQFNWVVTGSAALLNIVLNLILIPPYGMMGAAVATVAAYLVMFLGMAWWSQRVYPAPYQWRRVATL